MARFLEEEEGKVVEEVLPSPRVSEALHLSFEVPRYPQIKFPFGCHDVNPLPLFLLLLL